MAETLLEAMALTKVYRVGNHMVHALRGVDLTIERGECMAVVGESGSGKTTLGNLLLGIEPPSAGVIRFQDREMPAKRGRELRRCLQVVQQNPMSTLNPKRTIYKSVSLPLAVHNLVPRGEIRERAAELLRIVGLSPDYLDRYPGALSGGQRQRVALARALAAEPDCIVLDEPTSSLDVSVQARVLELLVELQQRFSLTYLFITHDLSVVRNISTRVAVLYRGRVVERGATESVFAAPRHRYTQMLLSSIPVVSEDEERIKPDWSWDKEMAGSDRVSEVGCAFFPRCPYVLDTCKSKLPILGDEDSEHLSACHNPG
ncbi:MAG: ATP-binding cassette domain-containing protein [Rhodospirillales bacterium]|nr:ATP-binding cassette domain-containing protein [Rhodospirillales bacterium]